MKEIEMPAFDKGKKLTWPFIQSQVAKKGKGRYALGDNLYLTVTASGSMAWIFRYVIGDKTTELGLGSVKVTPLAEAREMVLDYKRLIRDGIDPKAEKRERQASSRQANAPVVTFKTLAEEYVAGREAVWQSNISANQWRSNLERYINPVIGDMAVVDITTDHIIQILKPIWTTKVETARRVRARIERIIAVGIAHGDHKDLMNPARYHNHIELLMPNAVRIVKHHPSMPYADIPEFMERLSLMESRAARALEWLILTGTRTSETLGVVRSEIDIENAIWTIPAKRMKMNDEHRIPMSRQLLALIPDHNRDNLFPGYSGNALSNMAMSMMLRKMDLGHYTVHGFRSSIRNWLAEQTDAPHEIAERVLAHTVGGSVVAAYRRTDFLDKRAVLMQAWADFIAPDASSQRAEAKPPEISIMRGA